MQIFEVNLVNTIVVVAKDEKEAIQLAQYVVNRHKDNSPAVESVYPITKLSELNGGWDGDCIPWGEEGNPEAKPLNSFLENDL